MFAMIIFQNFNEKSPLPYAQNTKHRKTMNTLTKLQAANKQHDLYLIPYTYLRIHEKVSLELRKWRTSNNISDDVFMEAYERLTVDVIIDATLMLRRQIGNHCIGRHIPQIAAIALKIITLQNHD